MSEKVDPKLMACLMANAELKSIPPVRVLVESANIPVVPICLTALDLAQGAGLLPSPDKRPPAQRPKREQER